MMVLGIPSFDLLIRGSRPDKASGCSIWTSFCGWHTALRTFCQVKIYRRWHDAFTHCTHWIKRTRSCSTPRGGYLIIKIANRRRQYWPILLADQKDVLSRKILDVVIACLNGGRLFFFCNCKGERKFINISITFGKMSSTGSQLPQK